MKTQTLVHATRRILLAAAVAATATLTANAATTTYYQVAGTSDCTSLISLDGLPSNTEITSEPQLAFPGITLDDIPERASFFTTMYGEGIPDGDTIAVGMHEKRHVSDNHVDKIALQFVVYDNSALLKTKGVVLVLTNGDNGDGVYVQMFGRFNKGNDFVAQNNYYDMNSSTGNLSWHWLGDSEHWDGSWTSGDGAFQAKGIRIHGLSVAASGKAKGLAFPGVTLADIKDCAFVAGYRSGRAMEVPATNNWATYKTCWTNSANGKLEKIVMQFTHPTASYKTAVIQLTNGVDGVYAFQSHHAYDANAQRFSVDAETGVVSADGGSSSKRYTTSDDPPPYPVNELFLLPPCVKKTATKIWSSGDPSHPLKLDDIKDGVFGSRFFGGWVTDKNYYRYTPNSATGTIESQTEDDSGSVTNMVIWFEIPESRKRVKVMFENREDGIYATGIAAKYTDSKDNDGTFVETYEGKGYALCDLRVTVPTVHDWTLDADNTWSTLRDGDTLESDEVVRITVADPDAVLTVDENVEVAGINFVDGTGATLTVASGNTLTTESVSGIGNILNAGTLVKTGDGTATMPFDNASTGVTIVNAGTLKVASVTGTGTAHTVRVKSGATFDLNGVNAVNVKIILEDGANYANTNNISQKAWNVNLPVQLVLEGDATATASNNYLGIRKISGSSHLQTSVYLGNHTLSVNGSSGKEFILDNVTIDGAGKIVVNGGILHTYSTVSGADCTVEIGQSGKILFNGSGLTVRNFTNNGSDNGSDATLTVTGTLTTGSGAIKKLTLADGATIKASATQAQTVSTTFSVSGTITVDASEIDAQTLKAAGETGIPVLTVPTAQVPSGVTWPVTCPSMPTARARWVANGDTSTLSLFPPTGLMVIFR